MSNAGGGALPFSIKYADIIFAYNIPDPNGQNHKDRRVIIITPDLELAAGYPIVAVGVTSSLHNITPDYVQLPFMNPPGTRHPLTGLVKKSAALCTWIVIVDPNDISGNTGFTPPDYMREIQQKAGAAAKALGGWP